MGQTLTNGIFLPNEGERNCYTGLAGNWRAIDGYIGDYNVHVADAVIHVSQEDRDKWDAVDDKADASALTAHAGDTTIHVTAEDKAKWDAVTSKADASALTAHTGDTTIHVTAEDKAKWDAVTTKANDADVVHKSGAETIAGPKTFNSNTSIYNSDNSAVTPNLYLRSSKIEIAAQGNTSGDQNLAFADKNNTVYAYVKGAIQSNGSAVKIRAFCKDNSDNSIINEIQILANTNGRKIIFPSNTNETELGTSSYKWKDVNTVLINGLTPSGLSMPTDNIANIIDISGYLTVLDGSSANTYRAPDNGYIGITMNNCTGIQAYITGFWGNQIVRPNAGALRFFMPICKNMTANILVFGGIINNARFFPCQGNI